MAARRPFWKWQRWKSIGFCLWPPSTCIWNLKLKFQSKLDLCSGNHVVYRQTDRRTDGQTDRRTDGRTRWIQYTPPPTSLGGGITRVVSNLSSHYKVMGNWNHSYMHIFCNYLFMTWMCSSRFLRYEYVSTSHIILHNAITYLCFALGTCLAYESDDMKTLGPEASTQSMHM